MIELTVKVDPAVVEAAVRDAWIRHFGPFGYRRLPENDKYPAGYEIVSRQVLGYIENMDLSQEIAKVSKAQLSGVIGEVVKAELRAAARKVAREMRDNGTLFVDQPSF